MTTNATNGAAAPRRWQPRPELRDDLPLFDERLIPSVDAEHDESNRQNVGPVAAGVDVKTPSLLAGAETTR